MSYTKKKFESCDRCLKAFLPLRDVITCRKYWIVFFSCVITIPFIPLWIVVSHVVNCVVYVVCGWNKNSTDNNYEQIQDSYKKEAHFSIKGFCIACSWGFWIILSMSFILSALVIFAPVLTLQHADHLENMVQIVIVILGATLTYKIFTTSESDIAKFLQYFRKKFVDIRNNDDNVLDEASMMECGDAEAIGAKAGVLANYIWFDAKNKNSSSREMSML